MPQRTDCPRNGFASRPAAGRYLHLPRQCHQQPRQAEAERQGIDQDDLMNMRHEAFPIRDAVRPELSWTHYRIISRVEEANQRLEYV